MKASKRDPLVSLQDILNAIARIMRYTVKGREHFLSDVLTQDGVILQLSIIGEAAGKLPKTMKDKHAAIPWKSIIGLRNIIVHDYAQLKIERIWDTVEQRLIPLRDTVETMIEELHA